MIYNMMTFVYTLFLTILAIFVKLNFVTLLVCYPVELLPPPPLVMSLAPKL